MDGTNYNFGGGFTIGPNYTMTSNPSSFTTVGDVNFLGTVQVDGTFSIDSGGGDITIAGNITSTGEDEIISLTDGTEGDGSGTITLSGTVSASNITLVGDSGIILSGDITSNNTGSAGAIAFTGKDHWQILLQARAIENTAYVVAPAQTGIHYGLSLIHI